MQLHVLLAHGFPFCSVDTFEDGLTNDMPASRASRPSFRKTETVIDWDNELLVTWLRRCSLCVTPGPCVGCKLGQYRSLPELSDVGAFAEVDVVDIGNPVMHASLQFGWQMPSPTSRLPIAPQASHTQAASTTRVTPGAGHGHEIHSRATLPPTNATCKGKPNHQLSDNYHAEHLLTHQFKQPMNTSQPLISHITRICLEYGFTCLVYCAPSKDMGKHFHAHTGTTPNRPTTTILEPTKSKDLISSARHSSFPPLPTISAQASASFLCSRKICITQSFSLPLVLVVLPHHSRK